MVVESRSISPSTSRKSPGRTKYDPITLERGVTHDLDFEAWANKVWNFSGGPGADPVIGAARLRADADAHRREGDQD